MTLDSSHQYRSRHTLATPSGERAVEGWAGYPGRLGSTDQPGHGSGLVDERHGVRTEWPDRIWATLTQSQPWITVIERHRGV